MNAKITIICVLMAVAGLASPSVAQAQPAAKQQKAKQGKGGDSEVNAGTVRVYQQIPLMKKGRAEIGGFGGISVNDLAFVHLSGGANARFHVTQQWSIGASYHKYMRFRTNVEDTLTQQYGVFPERKFRDYYAGGDIAWAPIYGKMLALQSAISNFDVYFIAGAGVMRTFTQGAFGDNRISGNVGFGSRFYLSEWASIQTEVRDYIYTETLRSGDSLYQDWVVSIGFSVFIPPTYDYRYPK